MKLAGFAPLAWCTLSFLAGLAAAGGLGRTASPHAGDAALVGLCDGRQIDASPRPVKVRALPLPDGRVAHVVVLDEGIWQ